MPCCRHLLKDGIISCVKTSSSGVHLVYSVDLLALDGLNLLRVLVGVDDDDPVALHRLAPARLHHLLHSLAAPRPPARGKALRRALISGPTRNKISRDFLRSFRSRGPSASCTFI